MKKKKMSKRSLLNGPLVLGKLAAGGGEASTAPSVSRQVGAVEGKAPGGASESKETRLVLLGQEVPVPGWTTFPSPAPG